MSAVPNDQRTRQLYIDAAIRRAQAKARDARLQETAKSDDLERAAAAAALRPSGWVPGQRRTTEKAT
ncbi:MAG TPA: hypothetical protein VLR26_17300 [Frankiaceae bacterium]|nr:hypothetical protein [Frankiaceae bacterium]